MVMHLVAIEPAEHVATDTEPQDTPDVVTETPTTVSEPAEFAPAPVVPAPARVESDAHREWARARDAFIAEHTPYSELRELSPDQRQILFATIGDEPPYSTQEG